jgi:hypothetical protein
MTTTTTQPSELRTATIISFPQRPVVRNGNRTEAAKHLIPDNLPLDALLKLAVHGAPGQAAEARATIRARFPELGTITFEDEAANPPDAAAIAFGGE